MKNLKNPELVDGYEVVRKPYHYRGRIWSRLYIKAKCEVCKKDMLKPKHDFLVRKNHFCSNKCHGIGNSAEKNSNWTGGRKYKASGHVLVYAPDNPYNYKGFVPEHRLVVEKDIGRYLTKKELVHHINGIKDDNRIDNLVIVTKEQHNLLHGRGIDKLIKELIDMGCIKFNRKKLEYEVINGK